MIDTYLADNISELIIAGEVKNGQTIKADVKADQINFETV